MTAAEIAEILELPLSTVSLWLCRRRMASIARTRCCGKRPGLRLGGSGGSSRERFPSPIRRYERRHPGELVHVDIKKLGRISARGAATASSVIVGASTRDGSTVVSEN
jgi:hypothetical protein